MLRAVVTVPAALRDLAALGENVRSGRLEAQDVVRTAERTSSAARASKARLLAACDRAARLSDRGATDAERSALAEELSSLRLHPTVIERAGAAMPEANVEERDAFASARRSADRAKAEWTQRRATYLAARHRETGTGGRASIRST